MPTNRWDALCMCGPPDSKQTSPQDIFLATLLMINCIISLNLSILKSVYYTLRENNRFVREITSCFSNAIGVCPRCSTADRELKQRLRGRQQERQNRNRFRLAKQQLCTCITLFFTFLCRHCATTTWKCLISRFVEDVNTKQRLCFSFPELRYPLSEFNSRKNCQHLTNWTRWNLRDEVWSSATLLCTWRFRSRGRRCICCLSSLNTHTKRASFTQKNIQFGIHSGALHRLGEKLKYMNGWFASFWFWLLKRC